MKRSSDETARARYEDALRHEGRAGAIRASSARHISRRQEHPEHPEPSEQPDLDHELPSERGSSRSRFENGLEGRLERRSSSSGAREGEAEGENPGAWRLAESRRRAARHRMRATTLLMLIPTTLASITLMAMAHVVFRDWRSYESEASIARAQLSGLQEQLEAGQRRLKVLRSAKGREQILVEHGYKRPGDRLLLFPPEASPEAGASRAQNDIAARRGAIRNAASSSAWDRAARSVTGWLGAASGSPTPKADVAPTAAPSTSASPIAASQASPSNQEEEAVSPEDRIVAPREEAAEDAVGDAVR